ncbi:MAG: InlB B-repeat-containing protein [Bacteroidaceae bacterium]|nr:InlB B-repeat-containing protein [Bacteroidaceae bacterium]
MKQNLLNLKSWLLMMCLLFGVGASWAEDAVYKTAAFTKSSFSTGVQSYTGSFSSTTNSFQVDITNFNNNNNGWDYIKTGNKTNASVGTITTNAAIDKAVTKIAVTIDAITATSVNSITLYSGTSASNCTTSEGTFSKSTGTQTVTISSPAANKFYKISFDCKKGSSNGLVQVSKVEYYINEGGTTPSTPVDASWSVEPASVSVNAGSTATATITTNYDGTLSVSSNAESTAKATISGKVITVNGVAAGSTTLTVSGSATTNYNAISKTIDVTVLANSRPANEIFYESFDTNDGTGGNDNQWSGTIASSTIKFDNDGWDNDKGSGANKCAKFGTGSGQGWAKTPILGVACDAEMTFKAAAWNGNSESTTLKLSIEGGGTITPSTITLKKGEWTEYTVTLTSLTTTSRVKFEGEQEANNRFFLDEVSIVKAGAQEISNLIKTASADLFVGDEIADLKTYLNLPNDYAGAVTFSSTSEAVQIDGNYLLATGAGEATINVTAAANGNYLETTGTITLNISKKTPVIAWANGTKESYTIFNGNDYEFSSYPTAYLTNSGPSTIIYSISGDAIVVDGQPAWESAGTYVVTAQTAETDEYNASNAITYTIKVVDPAITMTPESGTVSAENPTVTFTGNGVKINYLNESENYDEKAGTTISVEVSTTETYYVSIFDDANNKFDKEFDVYFLKDAALAFSAPELRILVGSEDFAEPTLTKATDAEVTYSLVYEKEENIDKVATIDPATGKLTLKKLSTETQGAVTVKATTPATDEYTAGEATYELVVYRNVPTFTWSEESVTIDKDELDKLPTPIVQDDRNVTSLTSSNTDVAAIVDGAITFIGYGTTTITGKTYATWDYAPATASYELTFAPKYTVTFSVDGEETEVREETTGAGVTAPTVEAVGSYTFDGWTTSEVDPESTSKPSLVSLSGSKYMPTEDITLYAVYKRVEEGEGGSSDEGEFLIYADVDGTKYYMTGKPVAPGQTVNQVTVTTNRAEAYAYTIAKKEDSTNQYSISYEDNGVKYLNCTRTGSSSNYSYYLQGNSSEYYFTFSDGAKDGTTRMLSTYSNRAIAFDNNANPKVFKMFSTTNLTAGSTQYFDPTLEKISGGSTAYYTTSPTYSITIGQYEYATLVVPCNLDFTGTDVTAYSISALNGSNAIAAEQAKVPANKPIIVHGAQGTHKIPRVSEAADFETMLQAKDEVLYDSDGDEFDYFYLGVNNGNVCFKKLTSGSLAAGKCFIPVAKEANIKIISLVIDDEDATGISSVENVKMNNGAVYNLAGQRVNANAKGIVIVNGKKMFNK